jgi:glycosyltransferase involved in cell wall biosynthesis
LIHDFVELIITEPLCTSQIFGSKDLDNLCQRIGKANLTAIEKKNGDATVSDQDRPLVVYIVTKLQRSGGHSRVIEDFIKARPEARHIILSTELAGRSDADYLVSRLVKQVSIAFESVPKGNYQQRLNWLQKRLLEIHPNKIYLFNHHQDSVAVAAIQPEMGLDAYFYHHGDHHLCLGVYLSHLKHIDPHPMGYQNCRVVLGIENFYIPLTVEDKGANPSDWTFLNDHSITTCTAARSNKIEIPYFISYLDMVPQIMKTTGGKHVHIGRLSPWALHRIRREIKRCGLEHDRFVYTPWVPSVWKALHNHRVDLYIASFPYGGGLTLIEAMGAGVPVALHKHIYSRVLSGIDLAYPGAFSWRSPNELLDFCANLTPEYLEASSRSARLQYLKFHRREILEDCLGGSDQTTLTPGDLKDDFVPESDEWAYWMEKQVSFERVIRRGMYRTFRAIRAKLF